MQFLVSGIKNWFLELVPSTIQSISWDVSISVVLLNRLLPHDKSWQGDYLCLWLLYLLWVVLVSMLLSTQIKIVDGLPYVGFSEIIFSELSSRLIQSISQSVCLFVGLSGK